VAVASCLSTDGPSVPEPRRTVEWWCEGWGERTGAGDRRDECPCRLARLVAMRAIPHADGSKPLALDAGLVSPRCAHQQLLVRDYGDRSELLDGRYGRRPPPPSKPNRVAILRDRLFLRSGPLQCRVRHLRAAGPDRFLGVKRRSGSGHGFGSLPSVSWCSSICCSQMAGCPVLAGGGSPGSPLLLFW